MARNGVGVGREDGVSDSLDMTLLTWALASLTGNVIEGR
jgi:hypothetical protein